MSERLLKMLRNSATSKLNTRVRFPSPAPAPLAKPVPPNQGQIRESKMAEVDLDGVIRSIAKKQHKIVMDAARKRHGRLMGMAAKAKDKAANARYKHLP